MPRVLVSPTEYELSNEDYGKTFNLLKYIQDTELRVEAHVGHCAAGLENTTVRTRALGGSNRLTYYYRAFRETATELSSGSVDVYHHMNLSYRWFNPVLLAGLQDDVPVVIGPCQAGHAILGEEFNRMLSHAVGLDLSRSVTDPIFDVVDGLRDIAIDSVRMKLFEATLNAADKIVCVHEEAKAVYSQFVDESKIEIIPLGVDPAEFEFSERTESTSLVTIGHLRERKGYDILMEALDGVREERSDVHLHIFGDGPLREELHEKSRSLDLESNVTFHGRVSQETLKDYLAEARAFVHPSHSESFSLVRLEAMASGCPVVVSNIDGAHEMVRDGTDGYVVPRKDHKALADRILQLLSDFDLACEMGRNARQQVERKYDWEIIGRQYVNVYKSLI